MEEIDNKAKIMEFDSDYEKDTKPNIKIKQNKQNIEETTNKTLSGLIMILSSLILISFVLILYQIHRINTLSLIKLGIINEKNVLEKYVEKVNQDYNINMGQVLTIDQIPENSIDIIPYHSPNHLNNILDNLFFPYRSQIFRKLEEFEFIRDSLGEVRLKMVYSSAYHKDEVKVFRDKCRHHHLLVLVKTKSGNRFGGYTANNFNPPFIGLKREAAVEVFKEDQVSFLFNLDLKKIYEVKDSEQALFCSDTFPISFGESDLVIWNHFLSEGGTSTFPDSYGDFTDNPFEVTGGERQFEVETVEVYHVVFFSEYKDIMGRKGSGGGILGK